MEKKHTSRRNFIATAGKAGLALGLAGTILPSFATENTTLENDAVFSQEPLPYGYADLEPVIDALTMEIHYTKHAAGYTKNLNDAYAAELKNEKVSLEQILNKVSKLSTKMRNNAGGHYNHEFFWKCLSPKTTAPAPRLAALIAQNFGSFDAFKAKFTDEAKSRFGSGFTWAVLTNDNKIKICSTPNQDNPLMDVAEVKGKPILALDVWEHAYYLKYQNKRADYIENWWKIVNWGFVSQQALSK